MALVLVAPSLGGCRPEGGPARTDAVEQQGFTLERSASGVAVVSLDSGGVEAAGLVVARAEVQELARETTAFGVLELDPSRVTTLRSPLAGRLEDEPGKVWPGPSAQVEPGAILARLSPRVPPLGPLERSDLEARLTADDAQVRIVEAQLAADRARLERARLLNADDKGVADQTLEAAEVQVGVDEATLEGARASLALHAALLDAPLPDVASVPLICASGGTVLEVLARPGEEVEAGQELLRLADLSELVADVRLVAAEGSATPSGVRVDVAASNLSDLPARVLGPAPRSDRVARTLRLAIPNAEGHLRPGAAVRAWLELPGDPTTVLAIDAGAVLRHAGRTWVYEEIAPGSFRRHAVRVVRSVGEQVLVTSDLDPAAALVTAGAMSLLSHELLGDAREPD